MTLSKKQVKQLRAMANQLNPLLYIGKNDLTDAAVKQASETMDSHELLKVAVQDGSGLTAKEAADKLAGQIGAQVVQVIGSKFVLYRMQHDKSKRKIELVKATLSRFSSVTLSATSASTPLVVPAPEASVFTSEMLPRMTVNCTSSSRR
mgnify:CR=1 FL=1